MPMAIVTHEMNFAMNVSDRVWLMKDGEIVKKGRPEEFFNKNDTGLTW